MGRENIIAFFDVSNFETPYDALFTFHYIIVFKEDLIKPNKYLKIKINPIQKDKFLSFLNYAEKLHKKSSTLNYLKGLKISIREDTSSCSCLYISLEPDNEKNEINNIYIWSLT